MGLFHNEDRLTRPSDFKWVPKFTEQEVADTIAVIEVELAKFKEMEVKSVIHFEINKGGFSPSHEVVQECQRLYNLQGWNVVFERCNNPFYGLNPNQPIGEMFWYSFTFKP